MLLGNLLIGLQRRERQMYWIEDKGFCAIIPFTL